MQSPDDMIDTVARLLHAMQTRRGALRGAIIGGAVTALSVAPGPTDAAKRKERHRRCPDGKTRCSGVCVDTRTDPRNCGSCGNDCNDDEVCRNGDCVKQRCTVCDDDDECPFQSVQAAVDAATPGSVITICEGTYRENIVIAKDVELRGVDLR